MAKLFGKALSKSQILERVGDVSQLCEAKLTRLAGGNHQGVEVVFFRTGSGLNFSVIPGRGMDIGMADFKGAALSWNSSTGEVHPAFFEPQDSGMDRNYHGGLMHISGMTYSGLPCTDNGKNLGLHGRASNIPAQNVFVDGQWNGDDYEVWVQGKVRETSALGENVLLTRRVSARLGESKIFIQDRIENLAHSPVEHMLLYHTNFGWPLLSETTELVAPTIKIEPMIPEMAPEMADHARFQPPTAGYGGCLFYHELAADENSDTCYALINRNLPDSGLGIYFKYSKKMLPNLVEWKMMGKGHYVLECGPANCRVDGRNVERQRGTLQFLQPFEVRVYNLEIGILDGKQEIDTCIEAIHQLKENA
jgi:hypothetical protein